MDPWKTWKKGFDAWEQSTAKLVETCLRSPLLLGPTGALLSAAMRTRARVNESLAEAWGGMGLSTKRDQERALHALNQIQSRLMDIEERLEDLEPR